MIIPNKSLYCYHVRSSLIIYKILERKNSEIDEVKSQYKTKLDKTEEENVKLEKKVQSVLRDAQIVRENKDLQIQELKKLAEESQVAKNNRYNIV